MAPPGLAYCAGEGGVLCNLSTCGLVQTQQCVSGSKLSLTSWKAKRRPEEDRSKVLCRRDKATYPPNIFKVTDQLKLSGQHF
jgi:hypothetical protein